VTVEDSDNETDDVFEWNVISASLLNSEFGVKVASRICGVGVDMCNGVPLTVLLDKELALALALLLALTAANPLLIAACNASLTLDRVRMWDRGS
jgi:hypothetical protein